MKCSTCEEARSSKLPVSDTCRQCHDFSQWRQNKSSVFAVYPVTLYLHEFKDGERYVSSSRLGRTIAKKEMWVTFSSSDYLKKDPQ